MGRNHLPGNQDLERFGRPLDAESPQRGVGFGLGFAVVIDPVPGKVVCSTGELSWGGAASTAFWLDPAEELTVSFFTQLIPSSAHPIRPQLRQLVYQALPSPEPPHQDKFNDGDPERVRLPPSPSHDSRRPPGQAAL
jgi:CubicO group peptidase (beta-lactamase class C family)